jgi:alpha-beta hydrolase superfamily lysophospholipase
MSTSACRPLGRAGLVAVVVLVTSALSGGPAHAKPLHADCSDTSFSMRADSSLPETTSVAGTLCRQSGPASRQLLLITAHGATYNRLYWDWPQSPEVHSFVRNLVSQAAVLNLDLLGSGRSSRPLSQHVTQDAQASMLHQVVQAMRKRGFKTIVLIGHSSGSGTITLEAARYQDVDGLVVTGFLHRFAPPVPPPGGAAVPLSLYPAALDPAFADLGLDPGYLTTRPGTRGNPGFYNAAVADPAVIAYDDAHKDVVTSAHVAGFAAIVNDPSISRAVNVPVLSLVGNYDGGFCDSPDCPQARDEGAAWSPAAQLELHVIADAGHNIHLHGEPHARAEYAFVRGWLRRRFGPPDPNAKGPKSTPTPKLRLKVRPVRSRRGRRTVYRFRVTTRADGAIRPVRAANIRLGAKRTRTDARGRALVVHVLGAPRHVRVAVATKPGYESARAPIRLVR